MAIKDFQEKKDRGLLQLVGGVVGMVLLAAIVDGFLPDRWMRILCYILAALSGITIALAAVAIINLLSSKRSK